jgi:hypothetical protein
MLDSIHHGLNREWDMTANMATDMDVNMVVDLDVDVADNVDADSPCFHGPVSSGPNIFVLLI